MDPRHRLPAAPLRDPLDGGLILQAEWEAQTEAGILKPANIPNLKDLFL